jgi:hypothetical protein
MYVKPGSDTYMYLTLCFRIGFRLKYFIMKLTVAKLCGVGIVYLIFLLTEMKCHDSWRNVFLSSTMINKMLDK